MLIREVMTESVVTAEPHQTVRAIAELMRDRNVGSVVLVAGGRPVGFLTERDLSLSVLADGRDPSGPAGDHASSPVITWTLVYPRRRNRVRALSAKSGKYSMVYTCAARRLRTAAW